MVYYVCTGKQIVFQCIYLFYKIEVAVIKSSIVDVSGTEDAMMGNERNYRRKDLLPAGQIFGDTVNNCITVIFV